MTPENSSMIHGHPVGQSGGCQTCTWNERQRYRETLERIQHDLICFQNPDSPEQNAVWFASRCQFHLAYHAQL